MAGTILAAPTPSGAQPYTGGTPGCWFISGSDNSFTGAVTLYTTYDYYKTSAGAITGELETVTDTAAYNAAPSTTSLTEVAKSIDALQFHGASAVPVGVATVTHLSVSSGSTAGGTTVTITGTNFTPGSLVYFGGVEAASITVTSATSITAVPPAEGISTVDVMVVNQTGTPSSANSADKFSFISPTTTTLTDNGPNSAKLNQTVSFTVDVQVASGNAHAINGEKVYLEEEATNTSAGYNKAATGTLSGSTGSTKAAATFNIPGGFFSSAGNYNIIAVFDADSTHYGSQSGPTVQTMTANTISTSVSMTLNGISPATAGLPIETGYNPTVTVDVAPTQGAESGLKSGSVTIMDTSTSKSVGHGLLSSSGQVTITLDTTGGGNLLQVGNNDLVANFIANSNYSGNNSASQNQVINSLFEVDTMAQTATGFVAVFDAPVNPAPSSGSLTVYGTSPSKYGVGASVDLTVGSTNSEGSLVFDPSSTQATFVVTGGFTSGGAPTAGLLASDTQYTVSLAGVSSTGPVIKDTLGHALAGDDSSAGTNYSSNFTTPTDATEASVNAPYFARGFSEAVNLPNNASNGIPISITVPTGGTAVTSASFVIDFDPAALNVSAAAFTSGFSGSTTINNTTGTISVTLSSGTIAAELDGDDLAPHSLGAINHAAEVQGSPQHHQHRFERRLQQRIGWVGGAHRRVRGRYERLLRLQPAGQLLHHAVQPRRRHLGQLDLPADPHGLPGARSEDHRGCQQRRLGQLPGCVLHHAEVPGHIDRQLVPAEHSERDRQPVERCGSEVLSQQRFGLAGPDDHGGAVPGTSPNRVGCRTTRWARSSSSTRASSPSTA